MKEFRSNMDLSDNDDVSADANEDGGNDSTEQDATASPDNKSPDSSPGRVRLLIVILQVLVAYLPTARQGKDKRYALSSSVVCVICSICS